MFGTYCGVEEVLLYFLACLLDHVFNFDSWCVLKSFRVFCSWILNITLDQYQILIRILESVRLRVYGSILNQIVFKV